eukprot:2144924-Pyramimonas_sp.AAC.1
MLGHAAAYHVIRADATNGLVWQKCKLHAVEVGSTYLALDNDARHSLLRYCDLQVLQAGTAWEYLMCVMVKQMDSIGCPTWVSPAPEGTLRFFIACTDAGGDIRAVRRRIKVACEEVPGL